MRLGLGIQRPWLKENLSKFRICVCGDDVVLLFKYKHDRDAVARMVTTLSCDKNWSPKNGEDAEERGLGQIVKAVCGPRNGLEFCSKTLVDAPNRSFFIPNLIKAIFGKTFYAKRERFFHVNPSAHVHLTM